MQRSPRSARLSLERRGADFLAYLIRRFGLGGGNSLPGRALVQIHPDVLCDLAPHFDSVVVSATNGKTTTASLIRAVIGGGSVISNADGSNMDFGVALALLRGLTPTRTPSLGEPVQRAVLEVDEAYLGRVVAALTPKVVVLMNLSRDQLDRNAEVRFLARRWDQALSDLESTVVVANADDPLVVYAVRHAARVVYVAGGHGWRSDSIACPNCEAVIDYRESGEWSCECGLSRPEARWEIDEDHVVTVAGVALGELHLQLPGEFNVRNALFACAVAELVDGSLLDTESEPERRSAVLGALATVGGSGGRFVTFRDPFSTGEVPVGSPAVGLARPESEVVLMLAKNPAGWMEILKVIREEPLEVPVVLGLNAEIADGRDTSWIWDVAMDALAQRVGTVFATGRRVYDLEVRLRVAGMSLVAEPDQLLALKKAVEEHQRVLYLGNYTAFGEVYQLLRSRDRSKSDPQQRGAIDGSR